MSIRRLLALTIAAAAVLSSGCTASRLIGGAGPESIDCASGERICVLVQDADNPTIDIPNATIWVLGSDGFLRMEGKTDDLGIARFTAPREEDELLYLLVEADGYFIGGVRWIHGMREYYVLLKLAALR